jgi:hypothetical protein
MQPHTITTELTTAWTNIPLGLVALGGMLWVWRRRVLHPLKAALWAGMFGSLMVACDLGIVAHGFELAPETSKLIWRIINAALALTVTCFAAGAALDGWGTPAARRMLPGLLGLGAAFFFYATFGSETFLPFILYEGAAMLFCLAVYATRAAQTRLAGAAWMTAGVAITMLAAVLQATGAVTFVLVVPFDHNGVFHLVQLPGLLCLLIGLRRGLANSSEKLPDSHDPPAAPARAMPAP